MQYSCFNIGTQRNSCVQCCGELGSSPFFLSNGMKQGSVISPLVFSTYVDELNRILYRTLIGCHITGKILIFFFYYVDDLACVSPAVAPVYELLRSCNPRSIAWSSARISQDVGSLSREGFKSVTSSFWLSNAKVIYGNKCKYFNHTNTNEFTDGEDIRQS